MTAGWHRSFTDRASPAVRKMCIRDRAGSPPKGTPSFGQFRLAVLLVEQLTQLGVLTQHVQSDLSVVLGVAVADDHGDVLADPIGAPGLSLIHIYLQTRQSCAYGNLL